MSCPNCHGEEYRILGESNSWIMIDCLTCNITRFIRKHLITHEV